ncbi:hypothetical protein DPMN_183441, partial [Dreissena polymorpha]
LLTQLYKRRRYNALGAGDIHMVANAQQYGTDVAQYDNSCYEYLTVSYQHTDKLC